VQHIFGQFVNDNILIQQMLIVVNSMLEYEDNSVTRA